MPDGFHDAFLAALAGDDEALTAWCEPADVAAGLSVYRGTVANGCADALVAQFPSIRRVVGEAWLGAAATIYASEHPPRHPSLLAYGDTFPGWLTTFPPAADLPFLASLAQMDLMWTAAYAAADAAPLAPDAVAAIEADRLGAARLELHPATQFTAFADSAPGLWRALQPPATPPADFELQPEPQGLLVLRPHLDVQHRLIGPGELAFLAACRDGASLADAGFAALSAEADLDLAAAFAGLLAAGAFSNLRISE